VTTLMRTTPPSRIPGRPAGRQAACLAAAAAAAGLLTACASASTPQPGSAPGSAAGPAAVTTGRPMSPEPAGAGRLAACQAAALKVSVDASQASGAAGSTYYPVDFTNTASAPCTLYGYPGMSFVTSGDGTGRQIGKAAQQNPAYGKVQVRLAAGGVAHAWLQVAQAANYPAATCHPVTAHWLRVYAPGETAAAYVSQAFPACSSASVSLLTVMPVRSGKGVQGATP
jgi:hypothetical protein